MSPIEMRNLTAAYRDHPAVHHVPGTFEAGPLIAVVEPNGAGKSSLLGVIAGQLKHADCGRSFRPRLPRMEGAHQHASMSRISAHSTQKSRQTRHNST